LLQKGYTRLRNQGELMDIQDFLDSKDAILKLKIEEVPEDTLYILIDRFAVSSEEDNVRRIADSI